MADTVLLTSTLEGASGLNEDSAQNAIVVRKAGGMTGGDVTLAMTAFVDFWVDPQSNEALGAYIAPSISRGVGACIIKAYDITTHLDGSPHGSPIDTFIFTLPAALASGALPAEVALVATIRGFGASTALVEAPDGADPGSAVDRPRQRRTGRLYIGPLVGGASQALTPEFRARPVPALRDDLASACNVLWNTLDSAFLNWVVWSRVDAALRDVVSCEVDDAWDTQRRRGVRPTVRTSTVF